MQIVPAGATENGGATETVLDSPADMEKPLESTLDESSASAGGVNQDKSVLQTKLTKLTILIGKGG